MPPTDALPPAGLTWGQYLERWVRDRGGWLPLADELIHRAGDSIAIARDPQTVERGLRRLARREHKPGGQYGRWMLRLFGFTSSVEQWVKWMGQYHTRFSDLPCSLRLEHLALWNRPPIGESRLACWIHVGIAAVHLSLLDRESCKHWLARAARGVARAGPAAEIEIALLGARLETNEGDRRSAERRFAAVDELLRVAGLPRPEEIAYRARLLDQRAYHFTKPAPGELADVRRARELYAAIPEDPSVPFASFRKCSGLAYCEWQLGDAAVAAELAERAATHAGDGGLMRMRVMALNMLSRVTTGARAASVRERAWRMATMLEDEDLLRRVERCAPAS